MADDLRSQLLKAGLVTEEQVRKAESQLRKEQRKAPDKPKPKGKGKGGRSFEEPDKLRQQREVEAARQRDREEQRHKHEARERARLAKAEAERKAREVAERARRIIERGGRPADENGAVRYNFVEGGVVRTLSVSEPQRAALSRGNLGIARPHAQLQQYLLLDRDTALELREVCPEKLVLLHEPGEDEDEFAGLMW
jgi:uncharacterized protein YaiL (DUF2058 family)